MPTTGGGQIDARRWADLMRDEIVHKPESLDPDEEFPEPSIPEESSLKDNTRRSSIYGLIAVIALAAVIVGVVLLFALGLLI